ncbi:hypothetical protein JTE90_003425 [Oedothorax gibbosus]|uniref:DNA-directed DNA polymerase n=1 Tax=Oedothorax gibbosus TaxID=931172 RepID=A0AAV6TXR0_9ARAC|nr:hypothetical protein JTE90_003425 [Oedothorax gibbosus]
MSRPEDNCSFNFLPMGLSKMPTTFGLTELKKGYFPHLFNTPEHQTYVGALPSKECYCPDSMTTSERLKFHSWYEERKKHPFDFQKEMLEYCRVYDGLRCSPQGTNEAARFGNIQLHSCTDESPQVAVLRARVNGIFGTVCADTGARHFIAGESYAYFCRRAERTSSPKHSRCRRQMVRRWQEKYALPV